MAGREYVFVVIPMRRCAGLTACDQLQSGSVLLVSLRFVASSFLTCCIVDNSNGVSDRCQVSRIRSVCLSVNWRHCSFDGRVGLRMVYRAIRRMRSLANRASALERIGTRCAGNTLFFVRSFYVRR
jgi:hypothetical protein